MLGYRRRTGCTHRPQRNGGGSTPLEGTWLLRQQCLERLGHAIRGAQQQYPGFFSVTLLDPHAEAEIAGVEVLLFLQIARRERPTVGLCNHCWPIALVALPENDAHLVIGERFPAEDPYGLVCVPFGPTLLIAGLDPSTVRCSNAISLVPKRSRLLLELLAGVYQHHLAAVICRLVIAKQPDIGKYASVVEKLVRQHDDGVEPVVFKDPAADLDSPDAQSPFERGEPLKMIAMRLLLSPAGHILASMVCKKRRAPSLKRGIPAR